MIKVIIKSSGPVNMPLLSSLLLKIDRESLSNPEWFVTKEIDVGKQKSISSIQNS